MDVKSFLQLSNSLPEAMLLLDSDGVILAANKKAQKFIQSSQNTTIIGNGLINYVDNTDESLIQSIRLWSRSKEPVPASIKWKHIPEEETSSIQCKGFLLRQGDETDKSLIVLRCNIGSSITKQFIELNTELDRQKKILRKLQASREAHKKEHEKAAVTLHSIGDAVITTDANGNIEYLNPVAEKLSCWDNSAASGKPIEVVFNIINDITRQPAKNPIRECLETKKVVELENHTALISKEGKEYIIEDSAAPIIDNHNNIIGAVLVFHDVTGDRLAKRQLEYIAQHDTLTNLKNRYYFEQQLEHSVDVASRGHHITALLYIDLDQFKTINDSAGHAAGDELLVDAARRLQNRTRQGDILARLGGDEFGLILDDINPDQLNVIAGEYINALDDLKFQWEGEEYEVTCSIGAIIIDKEIYSPAEALRRADIACYAAKDSGRNRCHIYTDSDEKEITRLGEIKVVNRIKEALKKDEFTLFFQPIRHTNSGEIAIFEVLLRLQQDDNTLLGPGNFIPIAERHGITTDIDIWVVRNAINLLCEKNKEQKECQLTVNLSGASLGNKEILEIVRDFALKNPNLAQHLVLEITETAAVTQIDKASQFIKELRELGIRFALDDFGTGFSAFSYLKHLPVDFIKIDGSFVRDVADDPVDQAMVRSINHIAHSLGKLTIAEFVENEEILDILKEIGVDMVQGYHLGRPAPDLIAS